MLPLKGGLEAHATEFVVHGDQGRRGEEDRARAFANIRSTGIIASPSTRATAWSRCASPTASSDILLATRDGMRAALQRGQGARRWAAPRAACAASGCAKATRWSAGDDFAENDASRRCMTVCEQAATASAPRSTDYPIKGRGGKGVITIKTTERNGKVIGVQHRHRRGRPHDRSPSAARSSACRSTGSRRSAATPRACAWCASTRARRWSPSRACSAERDEDEQVVAAPVEVIEGEEDLSEEAADDTVEFETEVPEDDEGGEEMT